MKYIGCVLILHLLNLSKDKRKYIAKNIEIYYSKLKKDLNFAFNFQNKVNKFAKFEKKYNNYNIVYEKYKRNMYKYFLRVFFH